MTQITYTKHLTGSRVPLGAMPSNKLVDPRAGNAVGGSDLARAAALDDDSSDDKTGK